MSGKGRNGRVVNWEIHSSNGRCKLTISGGPSSSVLSRLRFDGDGLSRADSFTELAGWNEYRKDRKSNFSNRNYRGATLICSWLTDASLLSCGVSSKSMLSTKSRAKRTLFKWIHDCVRRSKEVLQNNPHACKEEKNGGESIVSQSALIFLPLAKSVSCTYLEEFL